MSEPITTTTKTDLKTLSREGLREFCDSLGLKSFRADQIFQWLYQKRAETFTEMTNLSLDLREKLDQVAVIHPIKVSHMQEASDQTVKFLFALHDGKHIESVLIPGMNDDGSADRITVCVSSQVGCIFGCSFCATGKMGYFRNLAAGEIVDQVTYINEFSGQRFGKKITNIVYMGMGEPLHNYNEVVESAAIINDPLGLGLSQRRITVSTVGLAKQIRQLGDEKQPFNLAVSLHAPTDEKRTQIMPINKSLNLKALEEALKHYFAATNQPITYEYLLFDHFNDGPEDAQNLAKIARWIPSKVNIIMYNQVNGVSMKRAKEDRLDQFMRALTDQGVRATVRRSRGDDIDAGCGQLADREKGEHGKTIS